MLTNRLPPSVDRQALRRVLVRSLDRLAEDMHRTPTAGADDAAEDVALDLAALAALARLIEATAPCRSRLA